MKPSHSPRRRLWKWVSICVLGAAYPVWSVAQDLNTPIIYPVPPEAPRTYPPPYKGGKSQPLFREIADRIERVYQDDKKESAPVSPKETTPPMMGHTGGGATPIMGIVDPNRRPAWRWYGWGGPVPGANPYAPSGHYAVVPPFWHAESGTTPGAIPATYINPAKPIGDLPPSQDNPPKPKEKEKEKEKPQVYDEKDLKLPEVITEPKSTETSTPKGGFDPDPLVIPTQPVPDPNPPKGPELLPSPKQAEPEPPAKLVVPVAIPKPAGTLSGGLQDLKKTEKDREKNLPVAPMPEDELIKLPPETPITPLPVPAPPPEPENTPKPDFGPPIPVVPADGIVLPADSEISRRYPSGFSSGVARGKISTQDEVPLPLAKTIRECCYGDVQLVNVTRTGASSLRITIRSNHQQDCLTTRSRLAQNALLKGWRIDFEVLAKN